MKIVAAWRQSGETATEYARLLGARPATLAWWASRLRGEDREHAPVLGREGRRQRSRGPALARVRVVEETAASRAETQPEAHGGPGWELVTGRGVLRAYGQEATRSLGSVLESLLGSAS